MSKTVNPLDILKHLPRTNCKQCGVKTCMAFADAVIKGAARLEDCPYVPKDTLALFEGGIGERDSLEKEQERTLYRLKAELAGTDFSAVAARLGTRIEGGRLVIKSLGKEFFVDAGGEVGSECHTGIPWLAIPMLGYVLAGGADEPSGEWIPFEEIPGGAKWARLFGRRCETAFKELADAHAGLFGDIVSIFSGTASRGDIDADVSLVLNPLPRLPVLVCYWMPDGDFESKLKIYFDRSAGGNLAVEYIYTLCVGIVTMLEKIAQRHV